MSTALCRNCKLLQLCYLLFVPTSTPYLSLISMRLAPGLSYGYLWPLYPVFFLLYTHASTLLSRRRISLAAATNGSRRAEAYWRNGNSLRDGTRSLSPFSSGLAVLLSSSSTSTSCFRHSLPHAPRYLLQSSSKHLGPLGLASTIQVRWPLTHTF